MVNASPSASPPIPPDLASTPQQKQVVNQANSTVNIPGSGVTLVSPQGGGSGGDLYGLGAWGSQTIDTSGFPTAIVVALKQAGINTNEPVKADDLAKALGSIKDPNAIAQLQQMLFLSGFYSQGTTLADLQLGRFGDKDTQALANSIVTAGKTNQSLGSYLTVGAQTGFAQGVINKASGVGVTPIYSTSPTDEDYALRNAAHSILDREPTQDELDGFRSVFDQAYMAGQKQAQQLQSQQSAAQLPDAATLGGALARTGQINPDTGLPITDAAEQPAQTIPRSATPGMRVNPNSTNADTMSTGLGPADNPAFGKFEAQRQQDLALLGQVGGAAEANNAVPTITKPPDINAAAEQYLRDNDAGEIRTQNALSAYAQILNFIKGDGSIQ